MAIPSDTCALPIHFIDACARVFCVRKIETKFTSKTVEVINEDSMLKKCA